MAPHELVEFLNWDSEFFGYRIARIKPHCPARVSGQQILQWCHDDRIDCLYFLADPACADAIAWAEDSGFRLMDIRATLRCELPAAQQLGECGEAAARIAPAKPEDLPALRRIARLSHQDSRFYWDEKLRAKSDDLFETWIVKSCEDFADAVLVAEIDGAPVGYVTLDCSSPSDAGIGLFAVAPEARGRGVGQNLVRRGLEWQQSQGAAACHVVTQGRNRAALRLYQRAGFRVQELKLWYHLWPTR